MAIDFKNIIFKYIKVTGGSATIDTLMTDKIFNTTKPIGIYRCFVFPNNHFGGVDYEDLQNLVAIEESDMWDTTNRDTFLGFNEETNQFIINYSAWLSEKDSNLKSIGEVPYAGQTGWFETKIGTTKTATSKFELDQTDGSKVYLTIKPFEFFGNGFGIYSSASCVENKPKSILGSTLHKVENALFAKCADDNSVIMVSDSVPTQPSESNQLNKLYRNNKMYGMSNPTVRFPSYKFGKKILPFETTSSKLPVWNYFSSYVIKNATSSTDVEYTHTDNLEDILASGESMTFYGSIKQNRFSFAYNVTKSRPLTDAYFYGAYLTIAFLSDYTGNVVLSKYSDKTAKGISCNLVSLDTRKPFVYNAPSRSIVMEGFNVNSDQSSSSSLFNPQTVFSNIPDGFIFFIKDDSNTGSHTILRYKKGDPIKALTTSSRDFFVEITDSVVYGNKIYTDVNQSDSSFIKSHKLSKTDAISGNGFSNYTSSGLLQSQSNGLIITVLRI